MGTNNRTLTPKLDFNTVTQDPEFLALEFAEQRKVLLDIDTDFSDTKQFTRIAIMPVSFNGSEEYAYLQDGLMDLMSSKIYGIGDFDNIDPNICHSLYFRYDKDIKRVIESEEFLNLNVSYVLAGSVIQSQNSFQFNANLLTSSGHLLDKIQIIAPSLDSLLASTNQIVIEMMSKHYTIIFLSGRSDKYKEQTLQFLKKCNWSNPQLYMRKDGDFRKDSIVKRELYQTHILGVANVQFVLDDRNQVVEMWRKEGLTCFQVAEGNF